MMESVRARQSPFRSLDFFTSADAAVFSGREEEIEEVATRIVAGPTLVLYGPSGVGKTSLLCAGVVPALEQRRRYRVSYVRPLLSPRGDIWRAVGANPAEPLAAALARLPALPAPDAGSLELTPPAEDRGLSNGGGSADASVVRGGTACAPHVLLLDQLEELFTRFDEVQRRPLWDGLVEVIEDPSAPVRLVLSLREEYLHFLDGAHPRLPNLLDRRFRLRGLAPFGARTAIVRPLVAGRIRYEPELVDRCVADLTEVPVGHSEEDGVIDPLLLQIVCSEVYRTAEQRESESPSLTVADYADLGGPAGVFRRHLDELFNRVHAEDHLLLKLVLQEMTTAHATKRPTTVSRLSQSGLRPPAAELQALLDKLVAASLVRKYDADPEPWYELVHDRLVQALPEHFARDQRFLRIRYARELLRQLSKGFSEGMVGAPLLNRQQLTELVEPFRNYIRFDEQELSLLFRSAVAVEHNVTSWLEAFETAAPGRAAATIVDMLHHAETRRGALATIGLLQSTDPDHRAWCLHLALTDNHLEVVSTASKTLNIVGGKEEAQRLRHALANASLRERALWVLAELTENPIFQSEVPANDLQMARREHHLRRFLPAWDSIQRAGWKGVQTGSATGALSSVGAIIFWCIAMKWIERGDAVMYAAGIVILAFATLMLSMICGHTLGRAEAKLRALDRTPVWMQAIQLRDTLRTGAILFGLCAYVSAFVLGFTIGPLSGGQSDTGQNTIIAVIALWAVSPAVVLAALHFTEWTMPTAPWHSTRTGVLVVVRTFIFSWLLSIGVGFLLLSFTESETAKRSIVVVATVLLGTWCSICATSIAGVFSESIWKRARSFRMVRPGWMSSVPVTVIWVVLVTLLWWRGK